MTIEFETRISDLQSSLDALKASKSEGWQEMAVKLIRKARYEDPELEIKRLQEMGVLDSITDAKLTQAVEKVSGCVPNKKLLVKAMMGRAIEIQRIYQSTHDVFIHAQQSRFLFIPDLIKECTKQLCPERDLHQFKCLRVLSETPPTKTIERYKTDSTYDEDSETREDLISADAYPFHTEWCESALYFLATNWSICGNPVQIGRRILQDLFPSMSSSEVNDYASRIAAHTECDPPMIGNLFLCCIPKEKSQEIQYRAHPFGPLCQCHPKDQDEAILSGLQKGELHPSYRCSADWIDPCPQYRLFTPGLRPENGVKIYLIPSDVAARKKVKEGIRSIVQEISSKVSFLGSEDCVSVRTLIGIGYISALLTAVFCSVKDHYMPADGKGLSFS